MESPDPDYKEPNVNTLVTRRVTWPRSLEQPFSLDMKPMKHAKQKNMNCSNYKTIN